jgi:hypothetical protein
VRAGVLPLLAQPGTIGVGPNAVPSPAPPHELVRKGGYDTILGTGRGQQNVSFQISWHILFQIIWRKSAGANQASFGLFRFR